ncbi:hypothetical protein ACFFMN_23460 [Planobispora siamensis]|uniref:Uncharacterized protein n=1 Tax=Planobispora siamensis TaxID=936338 RepID=A0A8J3STH5_9ACTN|nr:hypothetical protein [Planobispora siamensis]GIH95323.1 hypothetical protein Psi01_59530 [Planobispora siamensis]
MSADRAKRRKIICKCCDQPGENRGYGWCVTCYARWVARGRPAEGPPAPYENLPAREYKPKPIPERCRNGLHVLIGDNLIRIDNGGWRCRACQEATLAAIAERQAAAWRAKYDALHAGHDVVVRRDGHRLCRTCTPKPVAKKPADPRAAYNVLHAGHNVTVSDRGRLYCHTCRRRELDIDEIAVERAERGEAPPVLTPAEKELAILRMRSWGLTYREIGERIGCSLHTAWYVCNMRQARDAAAARAAYLRRSDLLLR